MGFFKNLKTRTKVLLIFVPVALLFIVQAATVSFFIRGLNADVREMEETRIETVLSLNAFLQELSANQQRYQLLADQDNPEIPFEDLVYEVFEAEERLQAELSRVEEVLGSGAAGEDSVQLLSELKTQFERYNRANRTVTATFSLYNEMEETIQALIEREQQAMRDSIAAIRAESATLIRLTVIVSTVVVLISLTLAFWLGTSLRRPIRAVASELENMAQGRGDLTERLDIDSKDEVGRVASGFNEFADTLARMIGNLKSSVETLNESGEALAANAEQTAASVNQINSSVQSISGLIEKQNGSVESSTSSVEEITRNIESLENMVEEQSSSVTEATASIEEMVANVQSVTKKVTNVREAMYSLVEAAQTGRERMNGVSQEIERVAGKSDLLLDTNNVMSGIAAQTNLLSMNAAIEAAHAGDAGAGFAVVAQEIRSLAENSSEQSKSIAENLKDIKGSIDQIVTSARDADSAFGKVQELVESTSELQSDVTQAMEEQAQGGQEVLEGLSHINEITGQVRTGAKEMQTGSQTVAEQMTTLRDVSNEVARAMQEISSGTSEIGNGVQELQETSQENQETVQRLAEDAKQFKT